MPGEEVVDHGSRQLFGREDELAALRSFAASTAWPRSLLVHGEPGIGKTSLLSQARRMLRDNGLTVVALSPSQTQQDLPLSGVRLLLEALGPGGSPSSELARVRAAAAPGRPLGALADEVVDVLLGLAGGGPWALVIDDAQWLDGPSAVVVSTVLRELRGPVAVLLASRSRTWFRTGSVVEPAPLDDGAIRALAASRATRRLAERTFTAVVALAGGVPFHAVELTRVAERGDGLDTVPASLLESHRSWVASLTPAAIRMLTTAAVASDPLLQLVAAAEDVDEAVVVDELLSASVSGIVELDDRVRFVHPLYREALVSFAPGALVAGVHRRLGELTDGDESLRHRALGSTSPDEDLAAELGVRADVLLETGSVVTAEEWGRLAMRRCAPGGDAHVAGLRVTVLALLARGLTRDAVALAETLRRVPLSATARVHLAELEFRIAFVRDVSLAAVPLDALIALVHDPVRSAELAMWRSYLAAAVFDYATMRAESERAAHLSRAVDDAGLRAQVAAVQVIVGLYLGEDLDRAALHRAVAGFDSARVPPAPLDPLFIACSCYLLTGDYRRAWKVGTRVVERALDSGVVAHGGHTMLPVLIAARGLGRTDKVLGALSDLRDRASRAESGATDWLAVVLTLGQRLSADEETYSSDGSALEETLAALDRQPALHGTLRALTKVYAADIVVDGYLARGDAVRAHSFAGDFVAILAGLPLAEPGLASVVPLHAEACIALGRFAEADTALAWLERLPLLPRRPQVHGPTLRARALRAAAAADLDTATSYATRAGAVASQAGLIVDEARALLVLGDIARRARRRVQARADVGQALRLFEASGQQVWASRARAELARLGGSRVESSGVGLTALEQVIAELASRGLRNRDIAARIHLADKTVEGYLSRIYGKLGVRGRAELARALPVVPDPDGPGPSGGALPSW